METAGKHVDDEEMREALKDNGIGRPSTRANIIETLFKRKYLKRHKKQLLPTETGIQLINVIKNDLLKSAELTGLWEKQLKEIEKGLFSASSFIKSMKNMVDQLVCDVRLEQNRIIQKETVQKGIKPSEKKTLKKITDLCCPACKKGHILKGKTAYGCSNFKNGCHFKLDFKMYEKKLSENQLIRLATKHETLNLKGFNIEGNITTGRLLLDQNFNVVFKPKEVEESFICPKCKKGKILKGKTAYGCENYSNGCDFKMLFETVKELLPSGQYSRSTVYNILKNYDKII